VSCLYGGNRKSYISKSGEKEMAKSESKNEGGQIRGLRSARAETLEQMPLVSAKRGRFESLKDIRIEAVLFEQLKAYKEFVRDVEGDEPDDGALISAGLEMLFAADRGFERWRQERRKMTRHPTERDGSNIAPRSSTVTGAGKSESNEL
jgi:hypothetical protein